MVRFHRSASSPPVLARIATIGCTLFFLAGAAAYGLIAINQPWAKPGARSSVMYMALTSSEGGTLIGARSGIAARVDLIGDAGHPLSRLALPAGEPMAFRPGAKHFKLSGLTRPLRLGDRVPLVLVIETAGGARSEVTVDAEVRNESPIDAELRAHRH